MLTCSCTVSGTPEERETEGKGEEGEGDTR